MKFFLVRCFKLKVGNNFSIIHMLLREIALRKFSKFARKRLCFAVKFFQNFCEFYLEHHFYRTPPGMLLPKLLENHSL